VRAVTVSRFGESPVVTQVTTPSAGPGQVLIKLFAAGVNPMDAKLASGEWRPAPAVFPMVLGVDGAGVVEATGAGTTRFFPGDGVFGQLFIPPIGASGTYAEYVAATEEAPLARVPDGVDLVLVRPLPTMSGHLGLQGRKASVPEAGRPLQSACALRRGTPRHLSRYVGQQTQSTARTRHRATVRRRLRKEADDSNSKPRRD
jgi:NADPH:quinone reductase